MLQRVPSISVSSCHLLGPVLSWSELQETGFHDSHGPRSYQNTISFLDHWFFGKGVLQRTQRDASFRNAVHHLHSSHSRYQKVHLEWSIALKLPGPTHCFSIHDTMNIRLSNNRLYLAVSPQDDGHLEPRKHNYRISLRSLHMYLAQIPMFSNHQSSLINGHSQRSRVISAWTLKWRDSHEKTVVGACTPRLQCAARDLEVGVCFHLRRYVFWGVVVNSWW